MDKLTDSVRVPGRAGGRRDIARLRDLEDMARMRLVVRGLDDYLKKDYLTVGMRWVDAPTHDLKVKVFSNSDTDLTMDYLRKTDVANQICQKGKKVAELLGLDLKRIEKTYLLEGFGGYHSPWLFETNGDVVRNSNPENSTVAEPGDGQWSIVICPSITQTIRPEAVSPHFFSRASDFRSCYHHESAGDRESNAGQNPWPQPTLFTTRDSGPFPGRNAEAEGLYDPRLTAPRGTDKVILHIHGYRMQTWERRAFTETAYKRLYWEKYGGRFVLFSWPTEYVGDGVLPQAFRPQNYDRSEFQARRSGTLALPALLVRLAQEHGQENIELMAHSMGNIVLAEGVRTLAPNRIVAAHYFSLQSAEASGAFQLNAPWLFPEGVLAESIFTGEYMPDVIRFSRPRTQRSLVTQTEWRQARIRWAPPGEDVNTYRGRNAAELNRLDPTLDGPVYHLGVVDRTGPVYGLVNGQDPATEGVWGLNQFTKPDAGFAYEARLVGSLPPEMNAFVTYEDLWQITSGRQLYSMGPFSEITSVLGIRPLTWNSMAVDGIGLTSRAAIIALVTRSRTVAVGTCGPATLGSFYTGGARDIQTTDGFGDDALDHSAQYNYTIQRVHNIWADIRARIDP